MSEIGGSWRMTVAMVLSGTIGWFVVSSGQSVQTVVWFRCLIGGLTLLAWLGWGKNWQRLDQRALGWLLLGGGALVANWFCLFSAYRLSGISVATVVYHVQPFFLLLLAALVQRELPDWQKLPWLAMAFLGVALTSGIDVHSQQTDIVSGVCLALAAAFLYAVATLATRQLKGIPPAQIAGLQLLAAAVALAPWADFSVNSFGIRPWVCLLTLGLVHTGLMYQLLYAAFQRLPANMIAVLSFIYPLVAILVDVLLFDVRLGVTQMAGMVLILIAVVANQRAWRIKQ